ncbi:MAG: agmatine deiminase family protein [Bacteroidota bacterium]
MKKQLNWAVLLFALVSAITVSAQHKHSLPAHRTAAEWQKMSELSKRASVFYGKAGNGLQMPANVRYPGEFEESQCVLISWSDLYDDNGNYLGADTETTWGYISAQLSVAIQPEAPVWIRVYQPSDTTRVLAFMQNLGEPLYNYRFIVSMGDGWWIRDFGPNGVYYGNQDSIAFVDVKYYPGRDQDDLYSRQIGSLMNKPVYESKIYAEGGNFMPDGFGKNFYSTTVTNVNTSAFSHNPPWTAAQVTDTMKNIFNSTETVELEELLCDGGTGHIDLYIKMVDEQTLMVAQYPNAITSSDRQRIEDNLQYIKTLKSTYNRPFRVYRIPHPTNDDGQYTDTTCAQMNDDARTFVNGLTINKTFIYPSYSDDMDGNQQQTAQVTKIFERVMPGYKVIPIDSREMSPFGGELHCITMQVPAENPVLFWHPSVDGLQSMRNNYHIVARITNKSGIQSATCMWRIRNKTSWTTSALTDSAGYFIGDITPGVIAQDDVIEYYLSATTQNGKTATKPITAPDGYYMIHFTDPITSTDELVVKAKDHLFNAYPNPAIQQVTINFSAVESANASISVTDITGKVVYTLDTVSESGLNKLTLDISKWKPGVYFYSYTLDGKSVSVKKFVVVR